MLAEPLALNSMNRDAGGFEDPVKPWELRKRMAIDGAKRRSGSPPSRGHRPTRRKPNYSPYTDY